MEVFPLSQETKLISKKDQLQVFMMVQKHKVTLNLTLGS